MKIEFTILFLQTSVLNSILGPKCAFSLSQIAFKTPG